MQKILVTGHTGMLGRSIVNRLVAVGKYEVFGVSKTQKLSINSIKEFSMDLADEIKVRDFLDSIKPNKIIHTAAFTNLQFCENHKQEAYQLHVNLSKTLAAYAPMVYISTDSVFDGQEGGYSEDYPTYPLNYYAQSKLQGEWASMRSEFDSLILRTNIYGFKNPGGGSLAEWALKNLSEGKSISGYDDVFFNPLYVGQLADLLIKLLDTEVKGTLHVGCSSNVSKFAFLENLAITFGFPKELILKSHAPDDGILRRPKNTTLNIQYMSGILNETPSLMEGLAMYKSDYLLSHEIN